MVVGGGQNKRSKGSKRHYQGEEARGREGKERGVEKMRRGRVEQGEEMVGRVSWMSAYIETREIGRAHV